MGEVKMDKFLISMKAIIIKYSIFDKKYTQNLLKEQIQLGIKFLDFPKNFQSIELNL